MKKTPFIVIFTLELLAALIAAGLLLSNMGALCYPVAAGVYAFVLTPFFLKLRKTEEAKKAKIRRNILLILLIPIAIAMAAVIALVVSLLLYFG